jgi:hypothetical protein
MTSAEDLMNREGAWSLLLRACHAEAAGLGRTVAEQFAGWPAHDWVGFLRLMDEHGVGPLAAAALLSAGADAIPDEVRLSLQERVRLGELRARLLVPELLAILEALEARGVAAIAHKGPALSMLAYGQVGARDSVDLDLVVREEDVPTAEAVLRERGYRLHELPPLTPRQEAAWRRTWNEFELVSEDGWFFVDLHWRMFPGRFPFRIDPARLWSRSGRTTLGGRAVPVFAMETLAVLLCQHGAKDRWSRLIWLCDVDRLIRVSPALDWDEVLAFAEESRSGRALGLGLLLAHRLVGTPLPALLLARLMGNESLTRLVGSVEGRLAAGGVRRSWVWEHLDLWPFHLEVFDGWRDRVVYVTRTLVTARAWDWERLPLPDSLYPLYSVLRPLRLGFVLAREAVRRRGLRSGPWTSGSSRPRTPIWPRRSRRRDSAKTSTTA